MHPSLSFKNEDLNAICKVGLARTYAPGEVIFSHGDLDRSMFYIRQGQVELLFEGGKQSKTLETGSFFGELAFILPEFRRTATARAKTQCSLIDLDQSTLDALIEKNPHLLFTLLRDTCAYLLSSEQHLIADLKEKNRKLQQTIDYLRRTREELDDKELIAQTDELTGLYNRRCLNTQLSKFIERARSIEGNLGVMMLDLDNFKMVNDTWGHQQGDKVLRQVAKILRDSIRSSDLACRPGGDEFVILLPSMPHERGLLLAEQIRGKIDENFPADEAGIKVTSSIGYASLDKQEGCEQIMARVDACLYQAKSKGRNRVVGNG